MWGIKEKESVKSESVKSVTAIPILCKLSFEDGVWNATARHLPVAVFGETFEDAVKNLEDALISHLESLEKAGKAEETIKHLQSRARSYLAMDEISPRSPIVKMLVGLQGREFVPVSC